MRHSASMTELSKVTAAHLTHLGRDKNGRHFADDIFKGIFLNENI